MFYCTASRRNLILLHANKKDADHLALSMHLHCLIQNPEFHFSAGFNNDVYSDIKYIFLIFTYISTPMARALIAHSPGLARTISMVPIGHLCIIHPGWLELPLSRAIFHGSRPVRGIEVLLYSDAYCRSLSQA